VPGLLKNFIDRGVMRQYPYFEKGMDQIRHPRRDKTNKAMIVFTICVLPSFHQFDVVKENSIEPGNFVSCVPYTSAI